MTCVRAATTVQQHHSPPDWFPHTSGGVRALLLRGASRDAFRKSSSLDTEHFTLSWENGNAIVAYDLPLEMIDNGLAQLVADQLGRSPVAATPGELADVIAAIVLSTDPDPAAAWTGFYVRTLERMSSKREETDLVGNNQVDVFAAIYRYATQLVRGHTVLDVASCLGLWPLMLAERGCQVTAVDTDRRAMALLATMGRRLETVVHALVGEATRLPCRSGAFATSTSIHLLEHLDEADAMLAVDELLRTCRERAIVAVPFEKELTTAFGHVRRFDLATLRDLGDEYRGRHGVTRVSVTEHHGGWIVLDKR